MLRRHLGTQPVQSERRGLPRLGQYLADGWQVANRSGYQPTVIHGSLKVDETTNCLFLGRNPVNTNQMRGSGDRMLPGGERHVSEPRQPIEGGPGTAFDANLGRFDDSTEICRRVLDRLRGRCEEAEMMPVQNLETVIESPEHRVSFTMASDDTAPWAARNFTREMLSAWGLEGLMDRTVLIVSELTTNAERHGGTPGDTERPTEANGEVQAEHITLTLASKDGIVGIEVEDNSPLPPIPRASGPDSLNGRGLLLVTAEADAWTARPNEDGSGKRVLAVVKPRDSGSAA